MSALQKTRINTIIKLAVNLLVVVLMFGFGFALVPWRPLPVTFHVDPALAKDVSVVTIAYIHFNITSKRSNS